MLFITFFSIERRAKEERRSCPIEFLVYNFPRDKQENDRSTEPVEYGIVQINTHSLKTSGNASDKSCCYLYNSKIGFPLNSLDLYNTVNSF